MRFDYDAQPKVTVEECNLCGESRFKVLPHKDRYGLGTVLMKCENCGLRFLNPRMTDEAYLAFYQGGIYRHLLEELSGMSFAPEKLEESQWRYADTVGFMLEPHMNGARGGTLLDVGGSTGVVADALRKKFGLKPLVVEPCEGEARRAKERGIPVVQGTLESLLITDPFDVVTLCQTVEHLPDIAGTLRAIRRLLKENGLFFVDIAKGSRSKVDHCYYLDVSTMEMYLEKAGFRGVKSWKNPRGSRVYFVARNP